MLKFVHSVGLFLALTITSQAVPFGFAANVGGDPFFVDQGYQGFNYGGGSGTFSWVNNGKLTSFPDSTLGAAWSNGGVSLDLTSAVLGGLFNVASIELFHSNPQDITVEGFLLGALVGSVTTSIGSSYTPVALGFTGIDQLRLTDQFPGTGNMVVGSIDATLSAAAAPELDGTAGALPFLAIVTLLCLTARRASSSGSLQRA